MPERRGMVLGIHAMGGTLSDVGAPLAVGLLLSLFDWRTTLQLSVLPAVIMGVVFLFFARHIPKSTAAGVSRLELAQISRNWLQPGGLLLIGMVSLYNMSMMALMSMSPLFLQRELGHTPALAGGVFAAAMLAGSLMQPLLGRYSDTWDRNLVFISGSVAGILCALGAALANSPGWIIFSLAASMALLIAIRSGVLASAVDYAGTRAATTLGFVFVLLDGVGALGALLAGMVAEQGLRYCFILAAGLSAASVVLALIVLRRDRSQQAALSPGHVGIGNET
jgi:MFS family permease